MKYNFGYSQTRGRRDEEGICSFAIEIIRILRSRSPQRSGGPSPGELGPELCGGIARLHIDHQSLYLSSRTHRIIST